MRTALCDSLARHCSDPSFIFLTGDLGYKALEPLQEKAKKRFINAGIAEQNMVSMAAGLARLGFSPWVYSIAPFLYARPLEQIRNDVCFHDLRVKLVGNGGGYAYGVMGSTHHAIEDYGILLTLPQMHVFVPSFKEDIPALIKKLARFPHPAYLRLGRDEKPQGLVPFTYSPWRKITQGRGATLLIIGPLVGTLLEPLRRMRDSQRPNCWVISELPLNEKNIPLAFLQDIKRSGSLVVVEEHVAHGGVGEMISRYLLLKKMKLARFSHHCALGYPSGFYGSQEFHRKECKLSPDDILKELMK